ncbi:Eco57I restriction-modification methylase domain-containing protein [Variovorax sp. 54]|uniref:Eco57I restriction-modification methylase domain-containing protein n=1 Tax=Variovorax sp. 54 TaxID=2035212 RepID=UPI00117C4152|nr:class I SAM-dependent methyltransferase [Variovorax sp. 54]
MPTLLGVAKALVGSARLSDVESSALSDVTTSRDSDLIDDVRAAINEGRDPLGDAYCAINSPAQRRDRGQTFTPDHVVAGMLAWVKRQRKTIARLVDPGAGSGRYTLAGLRAFPDAKAIAVEMDPLVAFILRANLAAAGFTKRAKVVVADFRSLTLPQIDGVTLWIGNPPYVRHHGIGAEWKDWYSKTLKRFGHEGSQLAGLHLHFFLKTLELSSKGDLGCYVTAAEWLDVKYGQALRQLLTNGLGGRDVFVVDPTVQVFGDAMVSAAITCFAPGSARSSLHFAEVSTEAQLRKLSSGNAIEIAAAKVEPKWSFLVKGGRAEKPAGFMELGEMFRVSRGQVTGLNRVWVEGADTPKLPSRFLIPAITDSTDITKTSKHVINDAQSLRRLICLPRDLSSLASLEKASVERFLDWARRLGAHETYTAKHRNPWWSVSTKEPAPVVMTYMGRRPPVFAMNKAGAQLINVAHGLYPLQQFSERQLQKLVAWLNENVTQEDGRVYAGGLTKFEPSEAMRILVPVELAS